MPDMKTSQRGLDLIAKFEGCRLTVYKDIAGYKTVGLGHLVKPGEDFSGGITREQAEELLRQDVADAEAAIHRRVTVPLTQNQFDALVDWVFNFSDRYLRGSTLLTCLNEGRYLDVPAQLLRWNKARVDGKLVSVKQLTRRRLAESELFLS